jgi:hypothetical protein
MLQEGPIVIAEMEAGVREPAHVMLAAKLVVSIP